MANPNGNPNWGKGVSGNPKGRPKGATGIKTQIQQQFIDMMGTQVKQNGKKSTSFFEAYNDAFIQDALNPKSTAFKFMAERLYGMDILADVDAQLNKSRREDTDFMTYRIFKEGFDIQQTILLSKARDIGLMAGRRAGKSQTNKLKVIHQSQVGLNQRILVIGLTVMKTMKLYWEDTVKLLSDLGIQCTPHYSDQRIDFENGSFIVFGGNSNKVEREKYRGDYWDLIVIDEAQSQPELGVFIREVIKPMLLDTNGCLMLTGSGPRTRGTFWEEFYNNPSPSGLRLNWNLSYNPFIYDYANALEKIKEEEALEETDPLYMREYLGLVCYDDDALVYRLKDENLVTDDEVLQWVAKQSPEDIKFVAGLDYGFKDSDAFVIIMFSEKSNEKFLVYEYKKAGTDVTELREAIKIGSDYLDKTFPMVYNRKYDIYADTSDQKIALEFSNRYGISIHPAYKYNKTLAIQMLQEEVRKENFKVKADGIFEYEALRTIFKRVEKEGMQSILTKEIDGDVYHPDLLDAVLYSLRQYWLEHETDHKVTVDKTKPEIVPEVYQPQFIQDNNTPDLF